MQRREPRLVITRDCWHVAASAAAFIFMPRQVCCATFACHVASIIASSTQDPGVQFVVPANAVVTSGLSAFLAVEWPVSDRPHGT